MQVLTILVLALQLSSASIYGEQEVGDIFVQAPAGYEVKLDGQSQGVVKAGEKGMILRDVPAGRHIVDVMKPASAGNSRYDVDVVAGSTATVIVPSMAMIMRPRSTPGTGDLQVRTPQSPCRAFVGGTSHELDTRDSIVRNIPAGKQTLRLQCGTLEVAGSVQVQDGQVVIVDANLTRKKLTVGGSRPRSLNVVVTPSQHHAIPADLPGDWKRALSSALDSSLSDVHVTRKGWSAIEISFHVDSSDDVWRFQQRISQRGEVAQVTWMEFVKTGGNRGRAKFRVDFTGGE